MASSMAIVMVNKTVLTTYAFPSVSFLLFWQGVVSVLFYSSRVRQKPDRYVLLAGVCHAANTLAGLSAAGSLNVAMFGALRKMSIVLTHMFTSNSAFQHFCALNFSTQDPLPPPSELT